MATPVVESDAPTRIADAVFVAVSARAPASGHRQSPHRGYRWVVPTAFLFDQTTDASARRRFWFLLPTPTRKSCPAPWVTDNF